MIIHKYEESEDLIPSKKLILLFEWAKSIGITINPKLSYPTKFKPGYIGTKAIELITGEEILMVVPNIAMLSSKLSNPPELSNIYLNHPFIVNVDCYNSE